MKRYKSTEAILFERSSFSSVDFSINPHIIDKPTYTLLPLSAPISCRFSATFSIVIPSGVDFNLKRPATIICGQNCVYRTRWLRFVCEIYRCLDLLAISKWFKERIPYFKMSRLKLVYAYLILRLIFLLELLRVRFFIAIDNIDTMKINF